MRLREITRQAIQHVHIQQLRRNAFGLVAPLAPKLPPSGRREVVRVVVVRFELLHRRIEHRKVVHARRHRCDVVGDGFTLVRILQHDPGADGDQDDRRTHLEPRT